MLFSIITVVLNDPAGLRLTAASIEKLSSLNFEWIVIDGASSDDTLKELANLEKVSPIVCSQKDKGIYDAMNRGIDLSIGQYLIFMNAGDTFADEMVLNDIECFLEGKKQVDVVLGGTYKTIQKCIFYSPPKDIAWILEGLPAFHQSTVYKSDLMRIRNYNLNYRLLADYEWLASQCVSGVTVGYLHRPISNFFPGGVSYLSLRQKFTDLFNVKYLVLGQTKALSALSAFLAILKTIFVMQVLFRVCWLYGIRRTLCSVESGSADKNQKCFAYYKHDDK